MKEKTNIVSALLIAVGVALMGVFISTGLKSFKKLDRIVTVKGAAEKEVPADRVIWPVSFTELGNDLPHLYSVIETKNKVIVDFFTTNGIPASEITASAPMAQDVQADVYNPNRQLSYRYKVTSVITVSSNNVERVRELMRRQAELIKSGIAFSEGDWRYQTQFFYTKLNDVKPEMVEQATQNARASASKFAADSGSELGKIKNAWQGQFTIEDRDSNTPYIKTLRVVTTVEYMLED